jgi:hypothetical protein
MFKDIGIIIVARNKTSLQKKERCRIASKPHHQTAKSDIFTSESRLQRMFVGSMNNSSTRKQLVTSLFYDQTSSTDA